MKKWNELTHEEKTVLVEFYPEDAKTAENCGVRSAYYKSINYRDIGAKTDEDVDIRLDYYMFTNFSDKDSKKEEHWVIRLGYYENNRDDRDALTDKDVDIRLQAKIYFDFVDSRDNELVTVKLTQAKLDILNKMIDNHKD